MKKLAHNMREKYCLALMVVTMIATSTALMSVTVFSADGDVTFDLTYYYPSGVVSGIPLGGIVIVDVYVDASALPDLCPEGMHGWGLYVKVDPEMLTPVGASGESAGYFLYDWSEANYPPSLPGAPLPYPPQLLQSVGPDYITCSEFFMPLPPLGAGGTGKLCTLYFESQSETAYSEITIDVAKSGYQDATGAKYAISPADGHYNYPLNGMILDTLSMQASENVKVRLGALVKDAVTMEPVSDADVTMEIYDPDGFLWVSDNMVEMVAGTGIYEWESEGTIRELGLEKGVYLVNVQASCQGRPTASDILEFNIDPPAEGTNQTLYLLALAAVALVGLSGLILRVRAHQRYAGKGWGSSDARNE